MDELTKKAIEATKKKAGKPTEKVKAVKAVNPNPEIDGGIVEVPEINEGELNLNPNKIPLGKNKAVTIKPWTGKTKKRIRKLFEFVENPEEIDLKTLIKVLVYDHIEEDVFLNEGEIQYLLGEIRKISIGDTIKITSECPICDTPNVINCETSDFLHYTDNNFPFSIEIDDLNSTVINIKDIETLKEYETTVSEILESEDYDGYTSEKDIEIAMHLEIDKLSTKEIINYLDNTSVRTVKEILNAIEKVSPKCEMTYEAKCKNCQDVVNFNIEIMQDIFENLLL